MNSFNVNCENLLVAGKNNKFYVPTEFLDLAIPQLGLVDETEEFDSAPGQRRFCDRHGRTVFAVDGWECYNLSLGDAR